MKDAIDPPKVHEKPKPKPPKPPTDDERASEIETQGARQEAWDKFYAYDDDHPHLYDALLVEARHNAAQGIKKGVQGLMSDIRARVHQTGRNDSDRWAVNNSWSQFYAIFLMRENQDLQDYFEVREGRAAA